ncbi:MAG: UDP-glucose 4-epimerase [Planctomycetaceae bacterium]|nr:UDP-glucose 4-epimerase [Planctomycetaceae bacterium]
MRVLVTGGAGFIGSHIVDQLLAAGHEAAAVDNLSTGVAANLPQGVPLYEVDIRDRDALGKVFDEFAPNAVSHQAAQMSVSRSVREPAFDADNNVMGLLNVLDHSVRVGVQQVVAASSGGVLYGDVIEPAGEDTAAAPISPYGISKWVGEKYLEFYAREHSLQCVALRYANVYGARQNPHGEAGVVAIFCQRMLQGEAAQVNGDGKYIRDYVYAVDVARANLLSISTELSQSFLALNIGTSKPTDVNELVSAVRSFCQQSLQESGSDIEVPVPFRAEPRAGDLRSSLVCAALAKDVLGWQPETALQDGLQQTVKWFA